ncbi:MAG: sel1 repeat family protein [Candidatus Methanoplasma sp.]|jgi:TPR repeat protein|nr:sel1 repeat family protein [Candidatus Methanoplasma sp.]
MAEKTIFYDAEAGSPYARLGLAYMYHHGKNIDPDPELAMKWYILSSEAGCSRAKWELAKIFRDGTIAEKDDRMFMKYLKAAAESGVPEAKVDLGFIHLSGNYTERDEESAFRLMASAAAQGNLMAQFMTGYMYGIGMGIHQNISEREELYSRVGLKGDGEMFYRIGRNFEYGLFNIDINLSEAGRWYKMGADMGHEKCLVCWHLVLLALDGGKHDSLEERESKLMNTDVEREKAVRDRAFAEADLFLETGDEANAFRSYEVAAELGNPTAMFTLAMMYHAGIFVRRSDKTALDMIVKASVAGSEDAQFVLGTLYEEGKGVKKSLSEAIHYYTLAAANGYLAAYYRLSLYIDHPEIHVRNSATIIR